MKVLKKVFSEQFFFFIYTVGRDSRFTSVENTIGSSPNALRAKFLGRDELFCFMDSFVIFKFGTFKNAFASITNLSKPYIQEIYPVGTNKKNYFHKTWQLHK